MELHELTITQAHEGLIKKQFSALELCRVFLNRIKEFDKKISSFLTVVEDFALLEAKKIDDLISQGVEIPSLAGIPIGVKDNILVKNIRCTAGSKILRNYIGSFDATVVKKLKAKGCVILGKTNLDEFAMGSSGERSAFGPTFNPIALDRVPGGSSSGSAAAVAANLCIAALGSDTGGSIRQPASFCGVVGLKPTYGAVSRSGLVALASSLDQIGPITKTVEDAKILFEVISGKDEKDSTSVNFEIKNQSHRKQAAKFKIENTIIGIPKEYFIKGLNPGVEKLIKKIIKKIEELGAKIEEISLPHTEYALATYYIIMPSEASANLARYDGMKYGLSKAKPNPDQRNLVASQKAKPKSLLDVYLQSRGEGFGEEVRRRIMLGTYALSAGYYEAYYLRAQKVRTLIKEDFDQAFQKVDFIFTPVSPIPAFKLGERLTDPLTMYLADIFTVSINLAGLPAISIPVGKVKIKNPKSPNSSGAKRNEFGVVLPVGLQIIGERFQENKIFEIGKIIEKIVK